MTISGRAIAASEMPQHERSWAELFRVAGEEWCDLDNAASLLEETKTSALARLIGQIQGMPYNRAEQQTKASQEWHDYLREMVRARTEANKKKIEMDYYRIKANEMREMGWQRRSEQSMVRHVP